MSEKKTIYSRRSAPPIDLLAEDFKKRIPQVRGVTIGRKLDHENASSWRVACSLILNDKKTYLSSSGKDLDEVMDELSKDIADMLLEQEQKQSPTILLHVFSHQRNTPLGTSSIAISRRDHEDTNHEYRQPRCDKQPHQPHDVHDAAGFARFGIDPRAPGREDSPRQDVHHGHVPTEHPFG